MHLYILDGAEPQILLPQHLEELPEEDQVFLLLMISKKMYQLVKFLICLTYLQSKKENQLKRKKKLMIIISSASFSFSLKREGI